MIPIVTKYQSLLLDNVVKMQAIFLEEEAVELSSMNKELIKEISQRVCHIKKNVDAMVEARKIANRIEDEYEKAMVYHNQVLPFFDKIRYDVDKLELIVDNQMWTLPKYRELLFIR